MNRTFETFWVLPKREYYLQKLNSPIAKLVVEKVRIKDLRKL